MSGCSEESWSAQTSACSRPPPPTTSTLGCGITMLPLELLAAGVLDLLGMRPSARLLHGLAHQEGERALFPRAHLGGGAGIRRDHLARQRAEGALVVDGKETLGLHQLLRARRDRQHHLEDLLSDLPRDAVLRDPPHH